MPQAGRNRDATEAARVIVNASLRLAGWGVAPRVGAEPDDEPGGFNRFGSKWLEGDAAA